jgi:UDP-3-O-[3-hydroxymyristoyl] glucosamine N-acyltransferase
MKKIQFNSIQKFFLEHKIRFEIIGSPKTNYTIASIFEPIENGFYFFMGGELPEKINYSLMLVNQLPINTVERTNCYLVIEESTQLIYYKLLSNLFTKYSTGIIASTVKVHPEAIIGANVQIDDFSIIGKCTINDNVIIGSHSKIHNNTFIDENTSIGDHSDIGTRGMAWIWDGDGKKIIQPQLGGVKIGTDCILASSTIIVRGSLNECTKIGNNVLFAPGCRIGHGTVIDDYVHFANNVITGGNTKIGNYSFIGSSAVFRPKIEIHKNTIVGTGAVVVKNTSIEKLTLMGNPAKEYKTKSNPSGMPKPEPK